MLSDDEQKKILKYLQVVSQNNFFGTVALKFQNGKLCSVKTETTLRPEELKL